MGEGGGTAGDWRFGGISEVWWGPDHSLTPAGLAPSAPSSSPHQRMVPAARSFHCIPGTVPPQLFITSLLPFMGRGRYFLYMKKYLQSFLKSWAVQQITGETLANPLGRWETVLLFCGGKGGSNQPQAPNVTQTHGDPEQPPPTHPCCDRNNPPLPSNPWSWGLILGARKHADGGWETSCATQDCDLALSF